ATRSESSAGLTPRGWPSIRIAAPAGDEETPRRPVAGAPASSTYGPSASPLLTVIGITRGSPPTDSSRTCVPALTCTDSGVAPFGWPWVLHSAAIRLLP